MILPPFIVIAWAGCGALVCLSLACMEIADWLDRSRRRHDVSDLEALWNLNAREPRR